MMYCEHHIDHDAVRSCAACAMPLCLDCGKMIDDHIVCSNEHGELLKNWSLLVSGIELAEVEALAANLKPSGMETRIFNLFQHAAAHRFAGNDDARLFVPRGQREEAERRLITLNLLDSSHAL